MKVLWKIAEPVRNYVEGFIFYYLYHIVLCKQYCHRVHFSNVPIKGITDLIMVMMMCFCTYVNMHLYMQVFTYKQECWVCVCVCTCMCLRVSVCVRLCLVYFLCNLCQTGAITTLAVSWVRFCRRWFQSKTWWGQYQDICIVGKVIFADVSKIYIVGLFRNSEDKQRCYEIV